MIPKREAPAFEAFVAASSDRLVRTAYLLCGDRGHAEDLVQTALLRTARRWSTARDRPHAYARQIVVNLAKDRWRGLSRRLDEVPLTPSTAETSAATATDAGLDHDELMDALRQLTAGQRTVVVLRYFDDLSVEDTAAALGCSAGTVKSQTARALTALRAALANAQPDCALAGPHPRQEILHADR